MDMTKCEHINICKFYKSAIGEDGPCTTEAICKECVYEAKQALCTHSYVEPTTNPYNPFWIIKPDGYRYPYSDRIIISN